MEWTPIHRACGTEARRLLTSAVFEAILAHRPNWQTRPTLREIRRAARLVAA